MSWTSDASNLFSRYIKKSPAGLSTSLSLSFFGALDGDGCGVEVDDVRVLVVRVVLVVDVSDVEDVVVDEGEASVDVGSGVSSEFPELSEFSESSESSESPEPPEPLPRLGSGIALTSTRKMVNNNMSLTRMLAAQTMHLLSPDPKCA